MVVAAVFRRRGPVLAAAEVATAAAAATAIAAGHDAAHEEDCLLEESTGFDCVLGGEILRALLTLHVGDVTIKYALTFSSPNCSAM